MLAGFQNSKLTSAVSRPLNGSHSFRAVNYGLRWTSENLPGPDTPILLCVLIPDSFSTPTECVNYDRGVVYVMSFLGLAVHRLPRP